ncbi:ABC transporter substrate-binding (seleno)protein SaoB [Pelotomaculum propionicicum]|uniref:ABC transporter substrate-binding (seleno)protein SaoB n=1 Tax=Pelotomaculum propionicicum TaxID=258475 RepID=UPI003B7D5552
MKKVFAALVVAVLLFFVVFTAFPQREEDNGKVKIGAPDDTGGMIIHYLVHEKGYQDADTQGEFELYPVKDCCGSTSQWALSSDLLDIAVMCPDAAASLLEKDDRFEIIGPCLLNSDIVVVRHGLVPQKIGVSQNRSHQEQIAASVFGPDVDTAPMLPVSIPYAYEKKAVDGVVVDALRGFTMSGDKMAPAGPAGHITYVLVVSKSFMEDSRYSEFIRLFQGSVEELNDPDVLIEEIRKYKNIDFTREEVEQWNRLGIRHVFTTPGTRG